MIEIKQSYIFNYPAHFSHYPDYTAHAGEEVVVNRLLDPDEYDGPSTDPEAGELMFEIRATDGWTGFAYESELAEKEQS